MFGVSISPPNDSIAEKPTSSRTMYSTFGVSLGGTTCAYGSQSGNESLMSMLMVPLKGLPISVSPPLPSLFKFLGPTLDTPYPSSYRRHTASGRPGLAWH